MACATAQWHNGQSKHGYYVAGPPLLNGRCTSLLRAPVSEMTYTVSSGTLNSIVCHTLPYHTIPYHTIPYHQGYSKSTTVPNSYRLSIVEIKPEFGSDQTVLPNRTPQCQGFHIQKCRLLWSWTFPASLCVWLGGRVVRTLDLRSTGREFESQPLRYRVQPWAGCQDACASVTEQYNLVPANGR